MWPSELMSAEPCEADSLQAISAPIPSRLSLEGRLKQEDYFKFEASLGLSQG